MDFLLIFLLLSPSQINSEFLYIFLCLIALMIFTFFLPFTSNDTDIKRVQFTLQFTLTDIWKKLNATKTKFFFILNDIKHSFLLLPLREIDRYVELNIYRVSSMNKYSLHSVNAECATISCVCSHDSKILHDIRENYYSILRWVGRNSQETFSWSSVEPNALTLLTTTCQFI